MQDQAKPDTLSAQQLQNLQRFYQEELKKIQHRMELRDRALDQAVKVCIACTNLAPMGLAEQMFKFLVADLQAAPAPAPDRQTPA